MKKTASSAPLTKQQVKQMIDSKLQFVQELKFAFATIGATNCTTSGSFYDFALIAQGDTANLRDGMTIILKHIDFRVSAIVGDNTNIIRVVVFHWFPDDAADPPSLAELFNDPAVPSYSQFLSQVPAKFRVLYDRTFLLDTYNMIGQVIGSLPLNQKIGYDIGSNNGKDHVYLMHCSDSGAATHPIATGS